VTLTILVLLLLAMIGYYNIKNKPSTKMIELTESQKIDIQIDEEKDLEM